MSSQINFHILTEGLRARTDGLLALGQRELNVEVTDSSLIQEMENFVKGDCKASGTRIRLVPCASRPLKH